LRVNTENLVGLAKSENWSIPELASKIGVDYSYLFRVLKNEKNGGGKLFNGIYHLCKQKRLNVDDYIFLNVPLSVDNSQCSEDH
jgi:transcriptional regulator with XRE-family HTH domain